MEHLNASTPQVIGADGTPVPFSVEQAEAVLARGGTVRAGGITVVADGSGLRARSGSGDVSAHEAFWFAWSQFHPDTLLWTPPV